MTAPPSDRPANRSLPRGEALAALAVVLVALATRLYRLDGQSLWGDEGTSVALALRNLAAITQGAALDIHPPLYYYLLHFWMMALGSGEIAVRSLSALLGVATVGLTYLLGRRLFGGPVGLVAALVSAVSPLQVQYSQEARMYMLAALLGLASAYCAVRAWGAPSRNGMARWLAAWTACAVGALYSHYFAATILLAENLAVAAYLALAWFRRGVEPRAHRAAGTPRGAAAWSLAQMAAIVCFAPWLGVMQQQWANWPATTQPYSLLDMAGGVLTAFSAGLAVTPGLPTVAAVFLGAAAVLACLPMRSAAAANGAQGPARPGLSPLALTVLGAVTPAAVMYLLSLRRPLFNPKYLLVATPFFYLLCAVGLTRAAAWAGAMMRKALGRRAPGAALAVVTALTVTAMLPHLSSYYHDPRFARDDYRAIARTITMSLREGDAVLLNAPGQTDIFGYYYHGAVPVYPLPRQRPLDEADTAAQLAAMAASHDRIWTVLWGVAESDPTRFVESWLDGRGYKSADRWFGNARLALYAMPSSTLGMQQQSGASFGADGAITLRGYGLAGLPAAGGDIVQLALFWEAKGKVSQRYKVFVHLLGPAETLWGQRDSEPGGGLRPTSAWQPGESIQDNYGIQVAPGTPPGEYMLEIGLYSMETGARLPARDAQGKPAGDRLLLGPVTVVRPAIAPDPGSIAMTRAGAVDAGGARLLGYELVQPGGPDPAQVVLFWQAGEAPRQDMVVELRLTDASGRQAWTSAGQPVLGVYPSSRWQAGEIVRDPHPINVVGLASGRYGLTMSAGVSGWIQLGEVLVK